MSPLLNGNDRRLLIVVVATAAILVLVAVLLDDSQANASGAPTTYSASSSGAKAAYLTLARLGYRVSRWEKPLDQLAPELPTTIVIADPQVGFTEQERAALDRFLLQGGRLLTTGQMGSWLFDLHAVDFEYAAVEPTRARALTPSRVTHVAPEITIVPLASWRRGDPSAIPLYGDERGVRVVRMPHGPGEVMWWASASPLSNLGLKDPGSLELLLESIGSNDRDVLWDEYVHGHRETALTLASRVGLVLVAQAVFAGLVIVATFSRRSGPVVEPAPDHRLSPLEFVRTLGAVYQRAGAASVAVDVAARRARYTLAQRFGLPAHATIEQVADAAAARYRVDRQELLSVFERAAAGRQMDVKTADALRLVRELNGWTQRIGAARPSVPTAHPQGIN
jgi:hypothetical protein